MNRRGFVLLTVLWALALASALVGTALAVARLGQRITANRLILRRAAWARDACAEILLARTAADSSVRAVDTVDLGRETWCDARVEDPGVRLNVNTADAEALRRLVVNDTVVDALLDWRDPDDVPHPLGAEAAWYRAHGQRTPRNGPFADVRELGLVRGIDSVRLQWLARRVTTDGTGQINLRVAPPEVLATLPGMTPGLLHTLLMLRSDPAALRPERLLGSLSADGREQLLARYQDFSRSVSYGPTQLIAFVDGGVLGYAATAHEKLVLIPAPGRLAVIRREVE